MKPALRSALSAGLLALCAAFSNAACSSEELMIAKLGDPSSGSSGGSSGEPLGGTPSEPSGAGGSATSTGGSGPSESGGSAGVGATGGGVGGSGMPPLPVINTPRQRVKVKDGKLVSDIGTPLRGLLLPADTTWSLEDFELIHKIATTTGLNAVHVYLENSSDHAGVRRDLADALVSLTAAAGLYLVLGYGTGGAVGEIKEGSVKAFWTLYAPRYASQPHVLYEIQNNPERTPCGQAVTAATSDIELRLYKLIRQAAPETHVLLFSTISVLHADDVATTVERVGTQVDWSRASFAMSNSTDCAMPADFPLVSRKAQSLGVPLIINQLPSKEWPRFLQAYEAEQVGWLHFRWFEDTKETLAELRSDTESAKVSWCPDMGDWPQDSATCR